jgi:hypothetical protein
VGFAGLFCSSRGTNETPSLYNNGATYPDRIIKLTDGRTIEVHRAILCQANQYFQALCDCVKVDKVSSSHYTWQTAHHALTRLVTARNIDFLLEEAEKDSIAA